MLPDDALLEIFSYSQKLSQSKQPWWSPKRSWWWWTPLVHTCRRWRHIVFAFPNHLQLVLICDPTTPVKKLLGIWPRIPISLRYHPSLRHGADENTIAALEHRDRVSDITFYWNKIPELESLTAVMQEPFPALTSLVLSSFKPQELVLILPKAFFNGSAPSLRTIALKGTAFPALPRLLSSAPHLVSLKLDEMPASACISAEAIASCLATLINLESLDIDFEDTSIHPGCTRPPSLSRAVFPALAYFNFKGISEYLEDFVSRIDAPILRTLSITLKGSNLHVPQILGFISRAEGFMPPKSVVFKLSSWDISLKFEPSDSLALEIIYQSRMDGCLGMPRICRELSPLLSQVVRLDLCVTGNRHQVFPPWWCFIRPTQWLEILRTFIATQILRVSNALMFPLECALSEITSDADAGLLPELRTLFLEGSNPLVSVPAAFEQFVSARQLFGLPIDVQPWEP